MIHASSLGRVGRGIGVAMLAIGLALGFVAVGTAGEIGSEFSGHHVNAGTVTHEIQAGKHVLTMSKDFPCRRRRIPTGVSSTPRAPSTYSTE